jgi:hypothetical protein
MPFRGGGSARRIDFEVGSRAADLRQPALPTSHLGGRVVVAAVRSERVVLRHIGGLGVTEEVIDLGVKTGFSFGSSAGRSWPCGEKRWPAPSSRPQRPGPA